MSTRSHNQAISTRFAADTLARVDELAQSRNCTRSEIIKEAVDDYLEEQIWFAQKVEQGLTEMRKGRVVSHVKVKEEIAKLGYSVD